MPNNRFMNMKGAPPPNYKPSPSKPVLYPIKHFQMINLNSQIFGLPPKPKPPSKKVFLSKTLVKISDPLKIQTAHIVPPDLPHFPESVAPLTTSPIKENL